MSLGEELRPRKSRQEEYIRESRLQEKKEGSPNDRKTIQIGRNPSVSRCRGTRVLEKEKNKKIQTETKQENPVTLSHCVRGVEGRRESKQRKKFEIGVGGERKMKTRETYG